MKERVFCGNWTTVGGLSVPNFNRAARAGDLIALRDRLLDTCSPRAGVLCVLRMMVNKDRSISLFKHESYLNYWAYPEDTVIDENDIDETSIDETNIDETNMDETNGEGGTNLWGALELALKTKSLVYGDRYETNIDETNMDETNGEGGGDDAGLEPECSRIVDRVSNVVFVCMHQEDAFAYTCDGRASVCCCVSVVGMMSEVLTCCTTSVGEQART